MAEQCGFGRFWVILGHLDRYSAYIHCGRIPEIKPGQTHLLLGWATTWDKTSILCFPAPGVRWVKTQNVKKLRTTVPDSVVTVFSISGPLAPGNHVFPFLTRARNFCKCLRPQNRPKSHQITVSDRKKKCSQESCGKLSRIAW